MCTREQSVTMTAPNPTTDADDDEKDSDVSQNEVLHLHELLCEVEDFLGEKLDTEVPTPGYDEDAYPPAHIQTPLKSRLDGWDTVKTYSAEVAAFCEQQSAEVADVPEPLTAD